MPKKLSNKPRALKARDKEYYSWNQFDRDVKKIVRRLKRKKYKFDGVWGSPRGGLPLAVMLSHELDLPFLLKPAGRKTLIVDDIADTGQTLFRYFEKNVIVTLYYHKQSITIPDFWLREKKKDWIIFPWEAR